MSYIGKVVEGIGHISKAKVQIFVTSDEGNRVSGFIMGSTGRPTNKKERIMARDIEDPATGITHPGGWTIVMDSLPPKPPTMTGRIRDMGEGDIIHVTKEQASVDIVRSLAGRLNINMDRKYSVRRTEEGCIVRRER